MHNHRLRAFAILVGMALVTAVAIGHAKPRSDDAHGYRTGTSSLPTRTNVPAFRTVSRRRCPRPAYRPKAARRCASHAL